MKNNDELTATGIAVYERELLAVDHDLEEVRPANAFRRCDAQFLIAPEQRRALRGEAGSRPAPADKRLLWLKRQRRIRQVRACQGVQNKITVVSEPLHHSFRRAALYAACRVLGIKQPIEIHTTTYQREHGEHNAAATHSFKDGRHVIKLDDRTGSTSRDLSDSLWHELIHCWQAEADPDFRKKYIAESAARGYDDNCYEAEANALRDDLAPGMPLCR
jgi:hypothetical protein